MILFLQKMSSAVCILHDFLQISMPSCKMGRNRMKAFFFIADTKALEKPDNFAVYYAMLPPARRKKIDNLRFEKDKRLSLGAGVLLQAACHCFSVEGADDELVYNSYGKPFFRDYPDVFFNLSHSGQRVMCVISESEAGCDVERIKAVPEPVIKRVFTEAERNYLLSEGQRKREETAFCRLWTLKESYLKAIGAGFSVSPESFSIEEVCQGRTVIEILGRRCSFLLPDYKDGYQYACCLLDGDTDLHVQGWSYSFEEGPGGTQHLLQLSDT